MQKSIFSKIIAREIPAEIVYEDERTIAILDINPVNPGHTLVIPKEVYINVLDIPANLFAHLAEVTHRLAPAVKAAAGADGINIIMNNETAAGQEVPHAHIHIVPRHHGDGFQHWKGAPYESPESAHAMAQKIESALE